MSCIFSMKGVFLCSSFAIFITHYIIFTGALQLGVNYGMLGDNLPPPDQVIALYKSRSVQRIRIFDPNPGALKALEGSGIQVIVGTRNEELQRFATDPSYATTWINTNIIPHASTTTFRCIAAGNEVMNLELANFILPALQNLDLALKAANLKIPVSTAISLEVMGQSFPPSTGRFKDAWAPIMGPIAAFLEKNSYPLIANVYPYFAYSGAPKAFRLDYVLFNTTEVVVHDGQLGYKNLFQAMVDSVYSALERVGGPHVRIIVGETGWPTAGNGDIATVQYAQTYNNNLVALLATAPGTPKRPNQYLETYIFAMFNEDLKPPGIETNFGIYRHDMTEVYHVNFNP